MVYKIFIFKKCLSSGHNIKLNFKWININELDKYDVRPKFLKKIVKNKSIIIGHIIFNELNKN